MYSVMAIVLSAPYLQVFEFIGVSLANVTEGVKLFVFLTPEMITRIFLLVNMWFNLLSS